MPGGRHGGRATEKAGARDPKPREKKPKVPKVEKPKKLTKAQIKKAAEEMKRQAEVKSHEPHRTLEHWIDVVLQLIGGLHGHYS